MSDGWHCPNGHLAFETLKGRGCVDHRCEYRITNLTKKGVPRQKPGRKPNPTSTTRKSTTR